MNSRSETAAETHSEVIVRVLEDDIIAGRRHPGSRLNEREIAQQFNVSRTPVREAVRYLSSAGLADIHPRRGAFVAKAPLKRLIQMFDAMTELEAVCAGLAARRMSRTEKRELKATHDGHKKLVSLDTADEYYEESLDFHRLILKGAHNEVLEEFALRLFHQLTVYRRRQLNSKTRIRNSWREHDAVLKAIINGDAEQAASLMRDHTHIVADNVIDLVGGENE